MLSDKAKRVLKDVLSTSDKAIRDELVARMDREAGVVASLGSFSNLTGVDGTGSNAAPLAGVNSALSAHQSKIDAIIAALKAAGLMSS